MSTEIRTNMANMRKRALLIAFHFPPQAESSGIQRTLSFAKNLGESDWDPLVLSANPMAYEQKNSSQLADLPAGLVVSRPYSLDSKRHLGILGRYPEIIALPDRWISWWLFAVPAGLSIIRKYRPEVIWSTFPIATAHLIGMTLQRLTGLPWIVDFRDPMLQDKFPKTRLQRKAYQWIEHQAITRCDKATFTTQGAMESYKKRFPAALHHKFVVIENGYDEESFRSPEAAALFPASSENTEGCITLLHSGVLYAEGRNPTAFFDAICALKKQGRIDAASFRVILRAPGEVPHFKNLVKTCKVEDIVSIVPPVSYHEALREMLAVDGLIIFQGKPFNTQIPAKIYEYFRARKPILGLLDAAGETARVLDTAGFLHMASMTSAEAIAPILENFIHQIRANEGHVAADDLITASSRKHRAKQLAQIFDQVVRRPRSGP